MYRFLRNLFFIIGVFIIIYPFFILISELPIIDELSSNFLSINPGGNGHTWTKLRDVDTTSNVDVLILGSSLAYRGIDTRNFEKIGLKAFNLGTTAQTPLQSYFLLEKYLDKLNPKFVIWDVSPLSFSTTGTESFIDLISNCNDCEGFFNMAIEIRNLIVLNAFLKKSMINTKVDSNVISNSKTNVYVKGGYVESFDKKFSTEKMKSFELDFKSIQKKYYYSIIEILNKRNIKILLVFSPVSKNYYSNISNISTFIDFIISDLEFESNNKFVNFNDVLCVSDSMFYDKIHLNSLGVSIYNQKLLEILLEYIDY